MAKKFHGKHKDQDNIVNQEETVKQEQIEMPEEKSKDKEKAEEESNISEPQEKVTDTVESDNEKLTELQNKYLRLSAEFDNYRKRTLKERVDLIKTAGEETILKIIPVLDDFERAIGFINNNEDKNCPGDGIVLIYNKLRDILTQQGLKEIEALHKEFDTDIHEAVTKIPAPQDELKGRVVDVIQKGYFLYDKVIRYAKVVVGE